MNVKIWGAAAVAFVAMTGAAQAEVLRVTGEFPARFREASLLHSLSINRFDGQDGIALANAIERAMGRTHFEMLGGRAGRQHADASLSGAVTTDVQETPFRKKEKRCTEKNKDGKCIKEEEVEVRCRRRAVSIRADLRMVDNDSGRVVYSESKPFREELSWCEGQNASRSVEDTVTAGIQHIANDVRFDIAPSVQTYDIRVRESTKGLSKEAAKRFKDLVKLTKRDARGACAGWNQMQAEAQGHPSLTFNLGLCAEQRGDYDGALALYRRASQSGAAEGGEGADRALRLIAGRDDARVRERRN
ncbi:tetratricopeptide repeat protein [Sphingomonas soli]|uniref:tetratricopeptide repeat protein n=1 Tax=Sphingomonas soli TaxID=266127 RepID=UPI0008369A86|nr:tetratricopeptide repeat protein [Sphingomonas soli]